MQRTISLKIAAPVGFLDYLKLCNELYNKYDADNVKLIIVPQVPGLTPIKELKSFIIKNCRALNIEIRKDIDDLKIRLDLEPVQLVFLRKFQEIATSKGGKCLSTEYINNYTKLTFECKNGHIWNASPTSISNNGSWCGQCNGGVKKTNNIIIGQIK